MKCDSDGKFIENLGIVSIFKIPPVEISQFLMKHQCHKNKIITKIIFQF
jgi:hypothetical protein